MKEDPFPRFRPSRPRFSHFPVPGQKGPWECLVTLEPLRGLISKWQAADAVAIVPGDSDVAAAHSRLEPAAHEWGFNLVRVTFTTRYRSLGEAFRNIEALAELYAREDEKKVSLDKAESSGQVQFCCFEPFISFDGAIWVKRAGIDRIEALAQGAATRWGHESLRSEHYLAGIIESRDCEMVFDWFEVDVRRLTERLEAAVVKRERGALPPGGLFRTSAAERMLGVAEEIAAAMRCSLCLTEHLLLAMIRDDKSIPGALFQEISVTFAATRGVVWKLLDFRRFGEIMKDPWSEAT